MNKYKYDKEDTAGGSGCLGYLFWALGLLAILFAAKCIIDFFNN